MLRGRPRYRYLVLLLLMAGLLGFAAYYPSMDEEHRLICKRLALVCVAPLSLAAVLTWGIMAASKR